MIQPWDLDLIIGPFWMDTYLFITMFITKNRTHFLVIFFFFSPFKFHFGWKKENYNTYNYKDIRFGSQIYVTLSILVWGWRKWLWWCLNDYSGPIPDGYWLFMALKPNANSLSISIFVLQFSGPTISKVIFCFFVFFCFWLLVDRYIINQGRSWDSTAKEGARVYWLLWVCQVSMRSKK